MDGGPPFPLGGQPQQDGASGGLGAGAAGAAGGNGSMAPYPPPAMVQQLYAQQALGEELRSFWEQAQQEVDEHSEALADFKNQQLPLARIKKIMKSDEDVRMISAEAPVLFARACEYFIQELTMRAWSAAGEFKRRTMQRSDVATAISRTDIFDFLVDIVPREEANDALQDGGGSLPMPTPAAQQAAAPGAAAGAALPPLPPQQQQQQQQQQYLPPQQQGQQQFMAPPPGGQQQPGGMPPPGMLPPYGNPYGMGMPPMPFSGLPPMGAHPGTAQLAQFQQAGQGGRQ